MKDTLILQDKKYISARRASQVYSYASDYVGQLCRAGKLDCKMVGRSWFVTEESLINHRLSVKQEVAKGDVIVPVAKDEVRNGVENSVENIVTSVAETSLVEVPKIIHPVFTNTSIVFKKSAIKNFHNHSLTASASHFTMMTLVAVVFFITSLFLFQSMLFSFNHSSDVSKVSPASVISATAQVVDRIISFFSSVPKLAMNLFIDDVVQPVVREVEKPPPSPFNGLAVLPLSNSVVQNEVMKEKTINSFSDTVEIKPDTSGTAGVITPVFKKAKGEDFLYVLVPVKDSKDK